MATKLFLVDGMSHLYRAYYAIQGLTSKSGVPTNAVYGFTNMLRKLVQEEKPDYLGVAIDLPGKTVRHEKFEAYKATRRPAPRDFLVQVPLALQVCEALKVPVISSQGYEADDVIGTLRDKAVEAGVDVVIVTIDKDMFQLVDDKVQILDTRTMTRLGPAEVEEKFGVPPQQVTDVLSLVGDSSDNIPGAPGIGQKGAINLIREYGSLEKLLEHSAEVSRKTYRESLANNRAQILQSRELVEIHRDLDVELDLDALALTDPDKEVARELFAELEFVSLLDEFLPAPSELAFEFTTVETPDQWDALCQQASQRRVAVAVLDQRGGDRRLAICLDSGKATTIAPELVTAAALSRILGDASSWVTHDLKSVYFRWPTLTQLPSPAADTMLMAYLIDPNSKDLSLGRLATEFLHLKLEDEAPRQRGLFAEPDPRPAAEAAAVTWELQAILEAKLVELDMQELFGEMELPLVDVLFQMETVGMRIDCDLLAQMSERSGHRIDDLSQRIYALAGEEFNLNSPKQLAQVLFEKLELPIPKKTRKAGHYSTGVEVLEKLAESHEVAQAILDYREVAKLKSTYLDALPRLVSAETGRVHTSYNQMVAATGRLSSSNPNLQNIPIKSDMGREIRRAFVPAEGCKILAADYSQIELRVMAHLSMDPVLIDAFNNNEDIHERTAREVFGMAAQMDPARFRRHAKVINFGIMYGLSAFGLAQSLKTDRKEAQQFIDDYFERYRGVREWIDGTLEFVRTSGFVRTLFGRIRPIPEIRSPNWNLRHFGERTAINAPIQGTAADLIKMAMIQISAGLKQRGLQSHLILQVHDELVLEVVNEELDEVRSLLRKEMEQVWPLVVPLTVDVAEGSTWFDAKP